MIFILNFVCTIFLIKLAVCLEISRYEAPFISYPERSTEKSFLHLNGSVTYILFTEKENYYDVCKNKYI